MAHCGEFCGESQLHTPNPSTGNTRTTFEVLSITFCCCFICSCCFFCCSFSCIYCLICSSFIFFARASYSACFFFSAVFLSCSLTLYSENFLSNSFFASS